MNEEYKKCKPKIYVIWFLRLLPFMSLFAKFRISETVNQCKRFSQPNGGFPYRNQIKI